MNSAEKAMLEYWKKSRPVGWSELDHIKNPTVNCSGDADRVLAKMAGKIAQKYNMNGNKK